MTHELWNERNMILAAGTQAHCFNAMLNIYGDAPVEALRRKGVRIVRVA
jgi:hypothetical protein